MSFFINSYIYSPAGPLFCDPYYEDVFTHFSHSGTHNSQIAGEASRWHFSGTSNSNVRWNDTRAKYGTTSLKFSGTGAASGGSMFAPIVGWQGALRTDDFCFEFWLNVDVAPPSYAELIDARPQGTLGNYVRLYLKSDLTLAFDVNNVDRITTSALTIDTWHYIALARVSGTTRLFIDGVVAGSWADSTDYAYSRFGYGGSQYTTPQGHYGLNGFIEDLRSTRLNGRYAANFTPPAQSLYSVTCETDVLWDPSRLSAAPAFWVDSDSYVDTSSAQYWGWPYATDIAWAWTNVPGSEYVRRVYQGAGSARPSSTDGPTPRSRAALFDGVIDRYAFYENANNYHRWAQNQNYAWAFMTFRKRALDVSPTFRCAFMATTNNNNTTRVSFSIGTTGTGNQNKLTISARRLDADASGFLYGPALTDTNWHMALFAMDWSTGTGYIYLDGQLVASGAVTSAGFTSNTNAGAAWGAHIGAFVGSPASGFADMDVASFCIGERHPLLSGDIDRLFGHAAHKYELTSLLPGGHAYKTAAPLWTLSSNVALLLHADGSNGSTTITDSSVYSVSTLSIGGCALSTAQSKWGASSLYFDGVNDTVNIANHREFVRGDEDFTIHFWVNPVSVAGTTTLITRRHNNSTWGTFLLQNVGGALTMYMSQAGTSWNWSAASGTITTGVWQHIAIVKTGTTLKVFIDGVQQSSFTVGSPYWGFYDTFLGSSYDGEFYNGYMDEIVFDKTALWTANFTPPTGPSSP